jgi:hypothetical protein
MIATKFGMSECSAFQVRIGGVKGVLMFDNKLEGQKV